MIFLNAAIKGSAITKRCVWKTLQLANHSTLRLSGVMSEGASPQPKAKDTSPTTLPIRFSTSLKHPEVVAEGVRWLAIYKPPGWSVGPVEGSDETPSLHTVYTAALEAANLFFPLRINRDIAGLTLACTDRGMNAQFSRHLRDGLIKRKYRALCHHNESLVIEPPLHISRNGNHLCLVDIDATKMRGRELLELLQSRGLELVDKPKVSVQLHQLVFPDPTNPGSGDTIVIEMSLPEEWEDLFISD